MPISSDIEIVVEHTLQNEDNLRLAAKVSAAFEQVRQRIVREFVKRLQSDLRTRLGDSWTVDQNCDKDPLEADWLVEIKKKKWGENCSVCLEACKVGPRDLDCYVWLNSEMPTKGRLAAELKEALDEEYGAGKESPDTVRYFYLEPPYDDWATENALVLLYRKADAAEEIAGQLESICRTVEPIADRRVRQ
jgi:hypothetical protein